MMFKLSLVCLCSTTWGGLTADMTRSGAHTMNIPHCDACSKFVAKFRVAIARLPVA